MTSNLVSLKKIEKLIKDSSSSCEEREELWKIVEEIVHHRIMGCILDDLDRKHHDEFLSKIQDKKFNSEVIAFLEEKSNKQITTKIQKTLQEIETEIIKEIL